MMNVETERKWILAKNPQHDFKGRVIHIDQIYNPDRNIVQRVRRSESDGEVTFTMCEKIRTGSYSSLENEWEIPEEEFVSTSKKFKEGGSHFVSKDRFVFLNQHGNEPVYVYEADYFKSPRRVRGMIVLEVELGSEKEVPTLPEGLVVIKEITGDRRFSNRKISASPSRVSSAFIVTVSDVMCRAIRYIEGG